MHVERWGALSVRDHLDTQALVANLLMYDRLVFPVFSHRGDERLRWRGENWDPDLQEEIVEQLGAEVAVKAIWNAQREKKFHELRETFDMMSQDAFATTRAVLAMDTNLPAPEAGRQARVIAAFNDVEEGKKELGLSPAENYNRAQDKLALLVQQRLLVPLIKQGKKSNELVMRARDLSISPKYRSQRQAYYEWQETCANQIVVQGTLPTAYVEDLKASASEVNHTIVDYLADHWEEIAFKTALTVIGIGLPFWVGKEALEVTGLLPAAYELVKFTAFDVALPAIQKKPQATAMLISAGKAFNR